jgi:hypothetical protein
MRPDSVLCAAFLVTVIACSRSNASSAAPDATASAGSALDVGNEMFGEPCVSDSECAGGVCFRKRIRVGDADTSAHDGYCSMPCDADTDCPVLLTSGRCGRGRCKRVK